MKIAITGATGLIGRSLCAYLLRNAHEVLALTRDPVKAAQSVQLSVEWIFWDTEKEKLDPKALEGVQVVIHLAGESVISHRWSQKMKAKIVNSRLKSTRVLWKALRSLEQAPELVISASAVGIYGSRGDEILGEMATLGSDFLSRVCLEWQNLTLDEPIAQNCRLVSLRLGVVLAEDAGILPELLPVFSLGLGGKIQSKLSFPTPTGPQTSSRDPWCSWIHIEDVARIINFIIEKKGITGVINAVAPGPVRQSEFANLLGKVLHQPVFFKIPYFLLRILKGEVTEAITQSARVLPMRLESLGFEFKFAQLQTALEDLLVHYPNQKFTALQKIEAPLEQVFDFFSKAENLEKITPPWLHFKILKKSTAQMCEGTIIDYSLRIHGFPARWRTLIQRWDPPDSFVDTQVFGPYAKWHHTHGFLPLGNSVLMEDQIIYRLPFGILGKVFGSSLVKKDIQTIFEYRRKIVQEIFPPLDSKAQ